MTSIIKKKKETDKQSQELLILYTIRCNLCIMRDFVIVSIFDRESCVDVKFFDLTKFKKFRPC